MLLDCYWIALSVAPHNGIAAAIPSSMPACMSWSLIGVVGIVVGGGRGGFI